MVWKCEGTSAALFRFWPLQIEQEYGLSLPHGKRFQEN